MIDITTDFDGANPHQPGAVERLGERAFAIRPFSEDGDGNYKYSLLVHLVNRATESVTAELVIDWQDAIYISARDYVLVGRHDRWRYFPCQIDGSIAKAQVVVPPGRWELALQPTYGLDRLPPWQRRFGQDPALSVRRLGQTGQDRSMLALELGPQDAPQADRIAIVARLHPYETAGSFAAEGALRWLLRSGGKAASQKWRVSTVLIANPDGVAGGCCKRTAEGGPDLAHQGATSDDPAAIALRNWLDQVQPSVLLDFHGWMYHYQDGLNFTDAHLVEQFRRQLESSAHLDRDWKGKGLSPDDEPGSLWSYCRSRYGTRSLIFSFAWYGRAVGQVRNIGAAVLSGLARCRW